MLRDPREGLKKERVPVEQPIHRAEIAVLPKPWHRSFVQAVSAARETLHVTNPCMQQLQQLWFASFRCVTYFVLHCSVFWWSGGVTVLCHRQKKNKNQIHDRESE